MALKIAEIDVAEFAAQTKRKNTILEPLPTVTP